MVNLVILFLFALELWLIIETVNDNHDIGGSSSDFNYYTTFVG